MLKLILATIAATALLSCIRPPLRSGGDSFLTPPPQNQPAESSSQDCSAPAPPKGSTRVYVALRDGKDGSGSSADNARDGSTAAAFDRILRCYSEGCTDPRNPKKSVVKTEH